MPDFLIIGAPKAGTTSLYHYLCQHPQIFMSQNKEPHFFAFEGAQPNFQGPGDGQAWLNTHSVVSLNAYQQLFDDASMEQKCGEASTMYLYLKGSCDRIAHHNPQTKLIAVLRHPLDRAYSHYSHLRREGREWESNFPRALAKESERIAAQWSPAWHYRNVGKYHSQLQKYLKHFGPEQLRIYLYDDLLKKPHTVYREIFEFIGVSPEIKVNNSVHHNTTATFRKNRLLHEFLTAPNGLKTALKHIVPAHIRKPLAAKAYRQNITPSLPLSASIRNELLPSFETEILQLQTLIKRDLSGWLQPSP
ncbi:MAG: sulfotransferase [Cyanobacteria bacterium J06553_1]